MSEIAAVASMPRGGPDASWLDRRLQTDVLEYTDRYDIPDDVKQKVITALDRIGTRTRQHGEERAHRPRPGLANRQSAHPRTGRRTRQAFGRDPAIAPDRDGHRE